MMLGVQTRPPNDKTTTKASARCSYAISPRCTRCDYMETLARSTVRRNETLTSV